MCKGSKRQGVGVRGGGMLVDQEGTGYAKEECQETDGRERWQLRATMVAIGVKRQPRVTATKVVVACGTGFHH